MSWYLDYVIRAKNEASGATKDALSDLEKLVRKTEESQKATEKWTAKEQRAAMAMAGFHEQALEVNAALEAQKQKLSGVEMDRLHDEALKMDKAFVGTTQRVGGFADTLGRTATTLARSADSFGLPVGPLRALDDVMDVAEIGFGNLSKAAAGFNAASIGVAGAGLAIGAGIGTAIRNLTGLGEWLDKVVDKMTGLTRVEEEAREASRKAIAIRQTNEQALLRNSAAVEQLTIRKVKEKEATEILEKASALLGIKITDLATAEKVLADAEANSTTGREKAAEKQRQLREEHEKAATAARVYVLELSNLGKAFLSMQQNIGMIGPEMLKPLEIAIGQLGQTMVGMPELTQESYENLRRLAEEAAKAGLGAEQIEKKLTAAGVPAADAARLAKEMTAHLQAGGTAAESLGSALESSFANLPNVILGAVQGGGNVGKAVGTSLGGDLGDWAGKAAGKAIGGSFGKVAGGVLGPIGSMLGGLLGEKLFSAFSIGGNKVIMQVNDMRDAFFETYGGFEAFSEKMAAVSKEDWAKKIFDAKTVEQFNSLVKEAKGLLDSQAEAEKALDDAVKKYGFSIEELGPKWKQQELDKQASQLLKDYELLVASGIDVNTVIAKMGPSLNDYVQTAIKAGTAIPEAMKPVIDKMIETGGLLDENGEAYKSAEEAGVTYTKTLTQGLSEAVEAIKDLVAALTGVPRDVTTTVTTRHEDEYGGAGEGGGGGYEPGMARGGIILPFVPRAQHGLYAPARPGGMLARVGEGGEAELVAPVRAILAAAERIGAAAAGGGRGQGEAAIILDGEVVGRWFTRRNKAGLLAVMR